MKISRRVMLGAAAAQAVFPQYGARLAVSDSASGLRLEQHGNPQRPTVALYLPEAKDPSVVIEMPEHAWRKETETAEPLWFYRMYSSDPACKGQVEWSRLNKALAFSMTTPSGYMLNTKAALETDGVAITHEVSSSSVQRIEAVEAVTCVKLHRPFTDVFLDRTYIHHPEGLDLIASETRDRTSKNAEEWLPCRYIARVGKNAPQRDHRVEKIDGVTKHFKSRAADTVFLATESMPGGWTAATFAKQLRLDLHQSRSNLSSHRSSRQEHF